MIKTVLLYLLCVLSSLASVFAQLTYQEIDPEAEGYFNDVVFINDSTGFLSGSSLSAKGFVQKTSNGGISWNAVKIESTLAVYYLNKLQFINDSTGFVNSTSDIYKTTDYGNTWLPVLSYPSGNINNYFFLNPIDGYLLNDLNILRISNGGLSLDTMNLYKNESSFSDLYAYGAEIFPADPSKIFIASQYLNELYSVHNERNVSTEIDNIQIGNINFLNADTGFITILYEMSTYRPQLLRTTNGGNSWTDIVPQSALSGSKFLYYSDFYSFNIGATVGANQDSYPSVGIIYYTKNSGQDWSKLTIPEISYFHKVRFIDPNRFIVLGYSDITKSDKAFLVENDPDAFILNLQNEIFLSCKDTITLKPEVIYKRPKDLKYSWTPSLGLSDTAILSPLLTASGDIIYYLEVADGQRFIRDSIQINLTQPVNNSRLIVTFDKETERTKIIIPNDTLNVINSYSIYKADSINIWNYDSIGFVNMTDTNVFIDNHSYPSASSRKYMVTYRDECGVESLPGNSFSNILATLNEESDSIILLNWSLYDGGTDYQVIKKGVNPEILYAEQYMFSGYNFTSDTVGPFQKYYYGIESVLDQSFAKHNNDTKPYIVSSNNVSNYCDSSIILYDTVFLGCNEKMILLDDIKFKEEESLSYSWHPKDGLSNSNVKNPLLQYSGINTYRVKATNGKYNQFCIVTIQPETGMQELNAVISVDEGLNKNSISFTSLEKASFYQIEKGEPDDYGNYTFNVIDTLFATDTLVFTDKESFPDTILSLYKISVYDSCHRNIAKSKTISSIQLSALAENETVCLYWKGFQSAIHGFKIFKGSDLNNLVQIDSLIYTNTYTDSFATGHYSFYRVYADFDSIYPCFNDSNYHVSSYISNIDSARVGAYMSLQLQDTLYAKCHDTITLNPEISSNMNNNFSFEWTPTEGLSDPYIQNPILTCSGNTKYKIKITNNDLVLFDSVQVITNKPDPPDFFKVSINENNKLILSILPDTNNLTAYYNLFSSNNPGFENIAEINTTKPQYEDTSLNPHTDLVSYYLTAVNTCNIESKNSDTVSNILISAFSELGSNKIIINGLKDTRNVITLEISSDGDFFKTFDTIPSSISCYTQHLIPFPKTYYRIKEEIDLYQLNQQVDKNDLIAYSNTSSVNSTSVFQVSINLINKPIVIYDLPKTLEVCAFDSVNLDTTLIVQGQMLYDFTWFTRNSVSGEFEESSPYIQVTNPVKYYLHMEDQNGFMHYDSVSVLLKTTGCSTYEHNLTKTEKLIVYPNPASGNFTIRNNHNLNHGEFKIYNGIGTIVEEKFIELNSSAYIYDNQKLSPGWYMITLTDTVTGKTYSATLIIQP